MKEIEWARESEKLEKSYIGRIGKAIEPVIMPLGFDWKMGISLFTGFAAKEIVVGTMSVLYAAGSDEGTEGITASMKNQVFTSGPRKGEKVFNAVTAFAFMIFVLLYVPCMATIATIGRESGRWRWAFFSIVYTTGVAWMVSFLVVKIGNAVFGG